MMFHLRDVRIKYFPKVITVRLAMLIKVSLLKRGTHETSLSSPQGPHVSILTVMSFNYSVLVTTPMHNSWYHCHVTAMLSQPLTRLPYY